MALYTAVGVIPWDPQQLRSRLTPRYPEKNDYQEVKQISAMVKDQNNIAAMCVKECSVFFPLGVSYFLVLHLGLPSILSLLNVH